MTGLYLREVFPEFVSLVQSARMKVVEEAWSSSFGDVCIIVGNNQLVLKLVRDKGLKHIDVSLPGRGDWHPLECILSFLDDKDGVDPLADLSTEHLAACRTYARILLV